MSHQTQQERSPDQNGFLSGVSASIGTLKAGISNKMTRVWASAAYFFVICNLVTMGAIYHRDADPYSRFKSLFWLSPVMAFVILSYLCGWQLKMERLIARLKAKGTESGDGHELQEPGNMPRNDEEEGRENTGSVQGEVADRGRSDGSSSRENDPDRLSPLSLVPTPPQFYGDSHTAVAGPSVNKERLGDLSSNARSLALLGIPPETEEEEQMTRYESFFEDMRGLGHSDEAIDDACKKAVNLSAARAALMVKLRRAGKRKVPSSSREP